MNKLRLVLFLLVSLSIKHSYSQETPPLKTIEFSIGINQLKTQLQADDIASEVDLIKGVEKCTLVLTDYVLVFQCTNHDLQNFSILDLVKQIVLEKGSDITTIIKKEI